MSTIRRPDTILGLALSERVLRQLAPQIPPPKQTRTLDLTMPAPPMTPRSIREVAKSALDAGETHYTDGAGLPELREAIADHLATLGYAVDAESIGVTNGGTEAIYIALQCALKPGSIALIVEPMSPHIVDMVTFIGATPRRVETTPSGEFVPEPDALELEGASVLLIASPSPVTGKRIPDDQLEHLIRTARQQGLAVILDLSYAAGLYTECPATFNDPDLAREIILTGSFSTAHGLSGWRIGFFSAPKADRVLFNGLKTSMSICTTAVSQIAALTALRDSDAWLIERRLMFARQRDAATAQLRDAGILYIEPDALPVMLIDVANYGGAEIVVRNLEEQAEVIVDSGARFGATTGGYVRINLGVAEDTLRDGLERLAAHLKPEE